MVGNSPTIRDVYDSQFAHQSLVHVLQQFQFIKTTQKGNVVC